MNAYNESVSNKNVNIILCYEIGNCTFPLN